MKYRIIALFLIIFLIQSIYAITGNKVLVVSSYGSDYQWSNTIIDGLTAQVKKSYPGIEVNVDFLSTERISDPLVWIERLDVFLSNYIVDKPLAIVLISDEAWMAYRSANIAAFADVPLLLCAVKPHSVSLEVYTEKYKNLLLSHYELTMDLMKSYNATGVLRELNIGGTIDLIYSLVPNLKQFVVITDNRLYGLYLNLLTKEYLAKSYPSIQTTFLDARFVNTEKLFNILPHISAESGVLLSSWLTGESGFVYSKHYVYERMFSMLKTPIFITNDIGLETGFFIGGYFVDAFYWGDQVGMMLNEILDGRSIQTILPKIIKEEDCYINWEVMDRFNLNRDALPSQTIFVNAKESIFVQYKDEIIFISIICFFIILCLAIVLTKNIRLRQLQRIANKAIEDVNETNKQLIDLHQHLEDALLKAQDADRLKSSFIANMDHEIRTPLNAIIGFSEVIIAVKNQEDREEAAMQIKESSEALLQLIMRILDLSQLESNSVTFNYGSVALDALCEDLIAVYRQQCDLHVIVKLAPSVSPLFMNIDSMRLSQILRNLLTNAVKFTHCGEIELGYFECDDNSVEFFVKDTGIGIPEKKRDEIFDRFIKLDPYTTGSGLGLSISKKIVELMRGEIGVESELGIGSRVWFRIPKTRIK